ncbi:MAG: spore maturation protein [Erysipelotrichaceae bacterium]|nr:spore maturation protein [Erysipelotrichaceae bacterium]
MNSFSLIFIPLLIIFIIIYSFVKKNNAYNSFLKGTKEGLNLFSEVFPSVLGMLLCVTLLSACGLIEDIKLLLSKILPGLVEFIEVIPMVLFRPISGSASIAVLDQICSGGPDSFACKMASTIQGSTDTTIYVLSLYFTTVGVSKWKHALKVGLLADVIGIGVGILLSLMFLK